MALRPATDDDWEALTGNRAPAEWFGLVDANEWLIEGAGAIYKAEDGSWWVTFVRIPGVRKIKLAHRAARQLLDEAKRRGIEVRAIADPRITGSSMWIERLGFSRSDSTIKGNSIWTL